MITPSLYVHDTYQRLKKIAEEKGLIGITDIATALGETPQTITNWRSRGIPANKMFKVARTFNVSPEWLVSGIESNASCFLDTFVQQMESLGSEEKEFAAELVKQYMLTSSPTIKEAIKSALTILSNSK